MNHLLLLCIFLGGFLCWVNCQCTEVTQSYSQDVPSVQFPKLSINSNGIVQTRFLIGTSNDPTKIIVNVTSSLSIINNLLLPKFETTDITTGQMVLDLQLESLAPPPKSSGAPFINPTVSSILYSLWSVVLVLGIMSGQRPMYLAVFMVVVCLGIGMSNADVQDCPMVVDIIVHPDTYEYLDVSWSGDYIEVVCSGAGQQAYGTKCFYWVSTYTKAWADPTNDAKCSNLAIKDEYILYATSDFFYINPDTETRIDPSYRGTDISYMEWTYDGMDVKNWGKDFSTVSVQADQNITCNYVFLCTSGSCDQPTAGSYCTLPTAAQQTAPSNLTCTGQQVVVCPYTTQCEYTCDLSSSDVATCQTCNIGTDSNCPEPADCYCSSGHIVSDARKIVVGIGYIVVLLVILILQ